MSDVAKILGALLKGGGEGVAAYSGAKQRQSKDNADELYRQNMLKHYQEELKYKQDRDFQAREDAMRDAYIQQDLKEAEALRQKAQRNENIYFSLLEKGKPMEAEVTKLILAGDIDGAMALQERVKKMGKIEKAVEGPELTRNSAISNARQQIKDQRKVVQDKIADKEKAVVEVNSKYLLSPEEKKKQAAILMDEIAKLSSSLRPNSADDVNLLADSLQGLFSPPADQIPAIDPREQPATDPPPGEEPTVEEQFLGVWGLYTEEEKDLLINNTKYWARLAKENPTLDVVKMKNMVSEAR